MYCVAAARRDSGGAAGAARGGGTARGAFARGDVAGRRARPVPAARAPRRRAGSIKFSLVKSAFSKLASMLMQMSYGKLYARNA